MDAGTRDRQLLTEYLLGGLTPAEREELDERSIGDDDFVDSLRMVEDDLVDAYVRSELLGETLVRFKSHYLASARNRDKVQFAHALRDLSDRSRVVSVDSPRRKAVSSGVRWQYAAAAAVLLATTSAWLAVENQRLRQATNAAVAAEQAAAERLQRMETAARKAETPPAKSDAPFLVAFNLAPQTRGAAQMPEIVIPQGADPVTLRLVLESGESDYYTVELKALPERRTIVRIEHLRPYGSKDTPSVALSLQGALLPPGNYLLELSGAGRGQASELVASYAFRVVR